MSAIDRQGGSGPGVPPEAPLTPPDGDGTPGLPPPLVCRFLRTKTAFGSPEPGAPDWQAGDDPTACYWCLCTMQTAGPDDALVHAQSCRDGRLCFEPRDGW